MQAVAIAFGANYEVLFCCLPGFKANGCRVKVDIMIFFFFFFFESIMVRLRYRTICSTLSIVTILLRSSSHLTFTMKKAIPLNPIESVLRCARV